MAQNLKIQSSQDQLEEIKLKNKPEFNLIAKLYSSGVEETPNDSTREMIHGNHNKVYIGFKLSHSFGSDIYEQEYLNKKAALNFEKIKRDQQLLDLKNNWQQAQKKVELYFEILESLTQQKNFREHALNELTKSYAQGRTDLRNLIEAMNSYFATLNTFSKIFGEYNMALNEWQAFQNKLISTDK